jgi:GrpB-like predicted nucleotidyltransferase (UPF0157 family)
MLGLKAGIVRLVTYQPEWKELFEVEAIRLRSCLGKHALQVEHIGSTAIEGMVAKPIIDINIAIENIENATKIISLLKTIGYTHKPDDDIPGRLYFVKQTEGLTTYHLSLSEPTSDFWKTHLLFRDYLRVNPDTAEKYKQLKIKLAKQYPSDRIAYLLGKEDFIRQTIEIADSKIKL